MPSIRLPPLPFQPNEELRRMLERFFKEEIYEPLMKELGLPPEPVRNSINVVAEAISSGRIAFDRGKFKGRFNSALSRELKRAGAKWDRTQGCWKIPLSKLSPEIRSAIGVAEVRFIRMAERLDQMLSRLLPEEIAGRFHAEDFFEKALWDNEQKISRQLKRIAIQPDLGKKERARIARDYSNNLRKDIKGWADEEVLRLRRRVEKNVQAGVRYEGLVDVIRKGYGVSQSKAKFLARQETNLMMAKFQESRYRAAGSKGYIWRCVHASPKHPVRPMHKKLNGKFIPWDNPPITNKKGDRNHAGEDYGCRCGREVVVSF